MHCCCIPGLLVMCLLFPPPITITMTAASKTKNRNHFPRTTRKSFGMKTNVVGPPKNGYAYPPTHFIYLVVGSARKLKCTGHQGQSAAAIRYSLFGAHRGPSLFRFPDITLLTRISIAADSRQVPQPSRLHSGNVTRIVHNVSNHDSSPPPLSFFLSTNPPTYTDTHKHKHTHSLYCLRPTRGDKGGEGGQNRYSPPNL